MTREDLQRFSQLEIDFDAIGLMEPGLPQVPYFCTPMNAEPVGRLGCDGIHFILLPEDERVFCVDPAMGKIGTYVLPVAASFREFLSFLLYCADASPISQIWWMDRKRFDSLLEVDNAVWPGSDEFYAKKAKALEVISEAFALTKADPYDRVKALQASFDASCLCFSDEYYDVLGIERE